MELENCEKRSFHYLLHSSNGVLSKTTCPFRVPSETQFKCRPRPWFICAKKSEGAPFSASYFRECPQQSVSEEMTGHFFALLISPIFAPQQRVSLFNIPDFPSERLLHLHSMPEREIQTSKLLSELSAEQPCSARSIIFLVWLFGHFAARTKHSGVSRLH